MVVKLVGGRCGPNWLLKAFSIPPNHTEHITISRFQNEPLQGPTPSTWAPTPKRACPKTDTASRLGLMNFQGGGVRCGGYESANRTRYMTNQLSISTIHVRCSRVIGSSIFDFCRISKEKKKLTFVFQLNRPI